MAVQIVFIARRPGDVGAKVNFEGTIYKKVARLEDAGDGNIATTKNMPSATAMVKCGQAVWYKKDVRLPTEVKAVAEVVSPMALSAAERRRSLLRPPVKGSPLWIIVCTKDRPKEVAKQVGLLLEQNPDCVVVIDDASTERAELPSDPRLLYVRLPVCGGPNVARDMGIRLAPPDAIIVEADDHDYIAEKALAAMRRAFDSGKTWVAYGDHWRTNTVGDHLPNNGFNEKGPYTRWGFRERGAIHTGIRAYRKTLYEVVGGYRASETPAGDLGLMLRFEAVLDCEGVVHMARPLCTVTIDMNGISRRRAGQQRTVVRRLMLAARHNALFATDTEIRDATKPSAAFMRVPEPEAPSFVKVKGMVLRDWPAGSDAVEVIAVVPTFKTGGHLYHCLDELQREGVPAVVVDDGCPKKSGDIAATHPHPDLKVVRLNANCGFAHAVNVGAKEALARGAGAVLVLNADAFLGEGSTASMLASLKQDGVGLVGNTHINSKDRGMNSQGSEWNWAKECYQHVGRPMPDPIPGGPPKDRDMVTFACALIRAEVWEKIGGMDERYVRAYWEDADFCMRARELGWRIVWSGPPATSHVCGVTSTGHHKDYQGNKDLFCARWADTGKVDKFARQRGLRVHEKDVVACMIVCEEEEFVAAAIESAAPLFDRLVIAVGGTEAGARAGMCGKDGKPRDKTLSILQGAGTAGLKNVEIILPPDGKPWKHKRDMREACALHVKDGEWLFTLDADEVWTDDGLWRLSRHMHYADVVQPGFHLIWNNLDTAGTGLWGGFAMYRAIRWRTGYTWTRDDNIPYGACGHAVASIPKIRVASIPKEHLYIHYSWVRPLDKIRRKVEYYAQKPNLGRRPRAGYFERVFMGWRKNARKVEQEFGTHPFGGGGATRLLAEHPESVKKLIEKGTIGGEGW